MDKFVIVDCPCTKSQTHKEKMPIEYYPKFALGTGDGSGRTKIFGYKCSKSGHKCKIAVDMQSMKIEGSKCINCISSGGHSSVK